MTIFKFDRVNLALVTCFLESYSIISRRFYRPHANSVSPTAQVANTGEACELKNMLHKHAYPLRRQYSTISARSTAKFTICHPMCLQSMPFPQRKKNMNGHGKTQTPDACRLSFLPLVYFSPFSNGKSWSQYDVFPFKVVQ